MESEKTAEFYYKEIQELAFSIQTLCKMGYVINISGAGTPSVLMENEGFDALFPEVKPLAYVDDDGVTWERRELVKDGICWLAYEKK